MQKQNAILLLLFTPNSVSLIHLLPLALIDIANEAEETEEYEMNPV